MSQEGFVYFILQDFEKEHLGLTKVGYALNPASRLSELQVGNPHPLTLLAAFRAPKRAEKWVHMQLSEFHIRGEWFALHTAWHEIAFWASAKGISLGDICGFIWDHYEKLQAKYADVDLVELLDS